MPGGNGGGGGAGGGGGGGEGGEGGGGGEGGEGGEGGDGGGGGGEDPGSEVQMLNQFMPAESEPGTQRLALPMAALNASIELPE